MAWVRPSCVQCVLPFHRFEKAWGPHSTHLCAILLYTLSSFFQPGCHHALKSVCMHRRSFVHSGLTPLSNHYYSRQGISHSNLQYLVIPSLKNFVEYCNSNGYAAHGCRVVPFMTMDPAHTRRTRIHLAAQGPSTR